MIKNLADYFDANQEIYLAEVSYNRIETDKRAEGYLINCTDSITVDANENVARLSVKRTLNFEPEGMFKLSVTYGAILRFNEKKKYEHNWRNINLAKEFEKHGDFVLGNLMNRISLLISEITSSFGQSPIVLLSLIHISEPTRH